MDIKRIQNPNNLVALGISKENATGIPNILRVILDNVAKELEDIKQGKVEGVTLDNVNPTAIVAKELETMNKELLILLTSSSLMEIGLKVKPIIMECLELKQMNKLKNLNKENRRGVLTTFIKRHE